MKKLLYTVMCCCALASCTNLDSERYDAINPDFFPTNEKDALTVSRLLVICQPILLFVVG